MMTPRTRTFTLIPLGLALAACLEKTGTPDTGSTLKDIADVTLEAVSNTAEGVTLKYTVDEGNEALDKSGARFALGKEAGKYDEDNGLTFAAGKKSDSVAVPASLIKAVGVEPGKDLFVRMFYSYQDQEGRSKEVKITTFAPSSNPNPNPGGNNQTPPIGTNRSVAAVSPAQLFFSKGHATNTVAVGVDRSNESACWTTTGCPVGQTSLAWNDSTDAVMLNASAPNRTDWAVTCIGNTPTLTHPELFSGGDPRVTQGCSLVSYTLPGDTKLHCDLRCGVGRP